MEILGIKNKKYESKNPLNGINRSLETAKEKISELEDIAIETQSNKLDFYFEARKKWANKT